MKRSTAFLSIFATLVCVLAWSLLAWPTTPVWTLPAVCNPVPGTISRLDWIACIQAVAGETGRAQPVNATTLAAVGTPGRLQLQTDSTPTNVIRYDDGTVYRTLVEVDKAQTLTSKTIASPSIVSASPFSVGTTGTAITGLTLQANANLSNGSTFNHNLGGTPVGCTLTASVVSQSAAVLSLASSTVTVGITTYNGAPGSTQTIYSACWK